MSIVADQMVLAQVAPRADEHSRNAEDIGFQDESAAVVRLASWIGAAA
ncbi:hypothetical protein [Streptomyces sp. enrichment culture]